ncbi:MAG: bifunctional DNA-formamidopyrimidine glycosylase/DNA-(apurinic or apyrimidinic site) lyase [Candidatus Shapirobacteria bacterium]|nr:bifunctional DNA-formamidopyrimidine glycosylase/DNA-(apurinic or apyrimidinic site) lyase [Candidatus Shapirobacteria bacterium]MDD5481402.1 bifunctional DNA-formamidopyrimidine glycosylase/DNA-(apurinic or apyrimidinic site) lyase [Candidatus Shapirobacteria bacterium]
MPELPEVETVKRELEKRIVGKKIAKIEVLEKKQFLGDPKKVVGREIKSIWRRAKVLVIDINGLILLVHLKMTGQIIYLSNKKRLVSVGHPLPFILNQLPNKTTRLVINLDDSSRLFFNDLRKFGWFKLLTKKQAEVELADFGPEPLGKDFTLRYFINSLGRTRRVVKMALLDQRLVAGIGNIYASEVLFAARVSPRRQANSLSDQEISRLYRAIKEILSEAIDYGGTSAADQAYVRPDASPGRYQNKLGVYQREGKPCYSCGGIVKKIKQNNRSTFWCPGCQK